MATLTGCPQTAARARGSNKCSTHIGKEVVFYCKNCSNLVCADCVTEECQGHIFQGIANVIPASKQKLEDFLNKAELKEIHNIQGRIEAAESDLTKNKNHFKKKIRKIRNQNDAVKKELDKITETFVKTYQGMEQQNSDKLLHYSKDLQTRIDKLSSQIQDVKKSLHSGSDILVFDMSQLIPSEFDDLPTLPVCSTPEFIPGNISVQELEHLLGKLNISAHSQSFNQSGNWNVISEFTAQKGHYVKSIHPAATDEAWLSFVNTNSNYTVEKMLLTDQSGQVKQTLDMDVPVFDFCLSPITGDIWFCSQQDNSIREVRGGKSVIRFTTDTKPCCICVTKDDHVILGHNRQVAKYTQEGQVVCKTSTGVRTPIHLSECPLTSNLAVVDDDRKYCGGNDKPFVSIRNDQLKPLYTYSGDVQGQGQQQSPTKPFNPLDICFTSEGELIVSDYNNDSVLLLTGTGRYITTLDLYTNRELGPLAVCQHSGSLWVSVWDESVKLFKNILAMQL